MLAAISTDYYTRLEQGRIDVSEPVLAALARVLKLDDDQREYAFELAGKATGRPRRPEVQVVNPQLQRLLDDLASIPAMVLGRQTDVLAWNEMGAALVGDFGKIPEKDRNYAKMIFSDRMRASTPTGRARPVCPLRNCAWRRLATPTPRRSSRWSQSCRSETRTSGGGGPSITWQPDGSVRRR